MTKKLTAPEPARIIMLKLFGGFAEASKQEIRILKKEPNSLSGGKMWNPNKVSIIDKNQQK